MFKRTLVCCVVGAAAVAAVAVAAEKVTIKPVQVQETRMRDLSPSENVTFFGERGLKVVVHVEGDAVNGATSYGKVKIAEALDDSGADLKPKQEKAMFSFGGSGEDDMQKIDRFPGMRSPGQQEKGFNVDLRLSPSSRRATSLKSLKGELQVLAGGEAKQVTITKLTGLVGKTVDDPSLKAAGLEVKIVNPKDAKFGTADPTPKLVVEVGGKRDALQKMAVVDKAGASVSNESMTMMNTTHFTLTRPLDDTMKLELRLTIGQRAVTVPFDIKDMELP